MPLLQRQSSSCKKRLQHQLYLARECPDLVFDISGCEITEIPAGVFSLCKVLQKEALLVHSNWLTSLSKVSGNFAGLSGIRILDLHSNRLLTLPDEIGSLGGLQVLNLESNRLKALPASIGNLHSLQTLNLRDNRLKLLPDEIGGLCSLRILDISVNPVTRLPKPLGHVRTLENLTLDADKMLYPDAVVCQKGTDAVMRFLCSELKVDYCPPSKVLLQVLPLPRSSLTPGFNRCRSFSANEMTIMDTVLEYENLKEKRRQERLALERQLEEDQRQQALLLAQAAAQKNHLVQYVAQEQARMDQELETAHQQKEVEREKLLETLTEAERASSELVQKLLAMNEKARRTEELLEQMERERMEVEQSYVVRQEEMENIRRKDVLASMEKILEQNNFLNDAIRRYTDSQDVIRRSLTTFEGRDDLMENVFNTKLQQQQILIKQLLQQEAVQKEAFEALQCQKDARLKRVTGQIRLIEQELAELTLLEMEQSAIKLNTQMNILEEKRKELTTLLLQLLDERQRREEELRSRLLEMEEQRLAHQTDYWLVQYQRLLDAKPQFLVDQEHHVEFQVIRILESAGAIEYLPQFALHRITIETLLQMNNDGLKRIGIRDASLREAVIERIEEFRSEEERNAEGKKESLDVLLVVPVKRGFVRQRIPSAPPFTEHDSVEQEDIQARGINSQCAICLDAQSSVLFLNCGHVCTCSKCAQLIHECPLDRSEIVQKIHLQPSSSTSVSPSAFPAEDDDAAF